MRERARAEAGDGDASGANVSLSLSPRRIIRYGARRAKCLLSYLAAPVEREREKEREKEDVRTSRESHRALSAAAEVLSSGIRAAAAICPRGSDTVCSKSL